MHGLRTDHSSSAATSVAPSAGPSRPREELAAWSNIKLWTREVGRIVKAIDRLSMRYTAAPTITGHPFDSPAGMLAFRDALDLKGFESEVKRYRRWVHSWERQNGRSKRVFAHNDTCVGLVEERADRAGNTATCCCARAMASTIRPPSWRPSTYACRTSS